MTEHVLRAIDKGVMTVTLNRADKKNALTEAMYAALGDALEAAAKDASVKVVLFTGSGDSFTAGNDLGDFATAGSKPVDPNEGERPVGRFLRLIATAEKPLIAAVNGLAVGVGVTMLLHCDLVYAGQSATFQTPFVNLGLVPEAGSTLLMPSLVGNQKAAELFLLGKKIDAEKAERIGLVADVLPDAELLSHATAIAQELAAKAPTAVKLTKQLLRGASRPDVAKRMAEEGAHFANQLRSAEVKEAISAFFEKRTPDFSKAG